MTELASTQADPHIENHAAVRPEHEAEAPIEAPKAFVFDGWGMTPLALQPE